MAMKKRVPRGGFVPEGSGDGEELVVIYITRNAWKRLQGEGSWFQESRYATTPSVCFPVKTRVSQFALENGNFYPARCEDVDAVAECCEEVIPASSPDDEDD